MMHISRQKLNSQGKRSIAMLLIFAMLLSQVVVAPISAANDGITDFFAGGSGTRADPWRISTAEQLRAFSASFADSSKMRVLNNYVNRYIVLTNDIDLENAPFTPIGYWDSYGAYNDEPGTSFMGNFDGQGYTVKNVSITTSQITPNPATRNYYAYGLFGDIGTGALVSNLNVDNITVTIDRFPAGVTEHSFDFAVGGLTGRLRGKAYNCAVSHFTVNYPYADGYIKNNDRARIFGGLVGDLYSQYAGLYNCHLRDSHIDAAPSNNTTTGNQYHVGGLVGRVRRTLGNMAANQDKNGTRIHNCAVVNTSFEVVAADLTKAYTAFDVVCATYKAYTDNGNPQYAVAVTDNYVAGDVQVTFRGLPASLVDNTVGEVVSTDNSGTTVALNLRQSNYVSGFNQTNLTVFSDTQKLVDRLNANIADENLLESWENEAVKPNNLSYILEDIFKLQTLNPRTYYHDGTGDHLIFRPALLINRWDGSIIGESVFTASVQNASDAVSGYTWTVIRYGNDGVTEEARHTYSTQETSDPFAKVQNGGSRIILPASEQKRDILVNVTIQGAEGDWTADAEYRDVPRYNPRAVVMPATKYGEQNTYVALLLPEGTSQWDLTDQSGNACVVMDYAHMDFQWDAPVTKDGTEWAASEYETREYESDKAGGIQLNTTDPEKLFGTKLRCTITYQYTGYVLKDGKPVVPHETTFTTTHTVVAEMTVGTSFYVDQAAGSDTNAGTLEKPFKTIEMAYKAIRARGGSTSTITEANRIIIKGTYEARTSTYDTEMLGDVSLNGYPIYYGPAVPLDKMQNTGTEGEKDVAARKYHSDLARVVFPELLQGKTTFFSQLDSTNGSYNDSLSNMPDAGVSVTFEGYDSQSTINIPVVGSVGEQCMLLMGGTAFENINLRFVNANGLDADTALFVYCNGFDFTLGDNVTILGMREAVAGLVHGILEDAEDYGRTYHNLHIMGTSRNAAPMVAAYSADTDGTKRIDPAKLSNTITVRSGTVGRVIGGGRNGNTFMPDMAVLGGSTPYQSTNLFRSDGDGTGSVYNSNVLWNSNIVVEGDAQVALVVGGQTDGVAFVNSHVTIGGKAYVNNVTGSSIGHDRRTAANFVYSLVPDTNAALRQQLTNHTMCYNDFKGTVDILLRDDCTVTHLSGGSLGRNAYTCANRGEYIHITMEGGTIEEDLFGGGRASTCGTYANKSDTLTNSQQYANLINTLFTDGPYEQPDEKRTIDITVTINDGLVMGDVFGGGYGYYEHLTYNYVNPLAGLVVGTTQVTVNGGTIHGNICGGGKGSTAYGDKSTYLAQVWGDTNVTLTGGNFVWVRATQEVPTPPGIFGAGLGFAGYPDLAKVSKGEETKNANGGVRYGSGTATVNIFPADGSTLILNKAVYGGSGNGTVLKTVVNIGKSAGEGGTIKSLFGFFGGGENESSVVTSQATVNYNKPFDIIVNPTNQKENSAVFGGSYGGRVNTAFVNIKAPMCCSVYGGGYGYDSYCENTYVDVQYGQKTDRKWDVYGGGMAGKAGTTYVNIGMFSVLQGDVYGAGRGKTSYVEEAQVTFSDTTGNNANTTYNLYGGSREGTAKNTRVHMTGGTTFGGTVFGGTVFGGTVYGGGLGGDDPDNPAKVTGTATVVLECGSTVKGDVFGAGRAINSWVNETRLYISGTVGTAHNQKPADMSPNNLGGRVFGGGDLGRVGKSNANPGNTYVYILPGATVWGYVFGGGNGYRPVGGGEDTPAVGVLTSEGAVYGKTHVEMQNAQLDSIYGCPNGGNITVYGNVYGGCNVAKLYSGNEKDPGAVTINIDSSKYTGTDGDALITIQGAVFAGGNASGSLTGKHASVKTTFGGATVNITDAADVDRLTLTGGVYGDGNLALISGDSTVNITNYGNVTTTTDKIYGRDLTTIQRAHTVNLENCSIELHGALDLVSAYPDNTMYAINRVKYLNLNGDTQLSFNNVVNQLNNMHSSVDFVLADRPGYGQEDERTSTNRICIANGTWLEIRDGANFGHITGLFMLDLMNAKTGVGGGYVYSATDCYDHADFIHPKIGGGVVENNFSYWHIKGQEYMFNVNVVGYLGLGNTTVTRFPVLSAQNKPLTLDTVSVVRKDADGNDVTNTLKKATVVISCVEELTGEGQYVHPITLRFDDQGNMTAYIQNEEVEQNKSDRWKLFLSELGVGKFPTLKFEVTLEDQTTPEEANVRLIFRDAKSSTDSSQTEGQSFTFNLHIETKEPDAVQTLYAENGKNYAGSTQFREDYTVRLAPVSACTIQTTTSYIPAIYYKLNAVLEIKENVPFASPTHHTAEITHRTTFPANTRVIMIDQNDPDHARYYYVNLDQYTQDANGVSAIPLTDFIPMDGITHGGERFQYRKDNIRIEETLIFILDFTNCDVLSENTDANGVLNERMEKSDFAMELNYYYTVRKVQQSQPVEGQSALQPGTGEEPSADAEGTVRSVFVEGAFQHLVVDFADDRSTTKVEILGASPEYDDEAITVKVTYTDEYPYHRGYYAMGGLSLTVVLADIAQGDVVAPGTIGVAREYPIGTYVTMSDGRAVETYYSHNDGYAFVLPLDIRESENSRDPTGYYKDYTAEVVFTIHPGPQGFFSTCENMKKGDVLVLPIVAQVRPTASLNIVPKLVDDSRTTGVTWANHIKKFQTISIWADAADRIVYSAETGAVVEIDVKMTDCEFLHSFHNGKPRGTAYSVIFKKGTDPDGPLWVYQSERAQTLVGQYDANDIVHEGKLRIPLFIPPGQEGKLHVNYLIGVRYDFVMPHSPDNTEYDRIESVFVPLTFIFD